MEEFILKKYLKVISAFLVTLLVLVGCGTEQEGNQASSSNGPVEIDFWYGLGSIAGQTMENIIKDFNESQDKYIVTGVQQADYDTTWQAVQAGLAAGEAPAVFLNTSTIIQNYGGAEGILTDLSDLYDSDEFAGDELLEVFKNPAMVEGKPYAVPAYGTTQVIYYNKQILEEAGLDPDEVYSTWENIADASRVMIDKAGTNKGHMLMYGPDNLVDLALSNNGLILSEDGTEVLINSPEWVEAWDFARNHIHDTGNMGINSSGQGWEYWYATIDTVMTGNSGSYTGSSGDRGDLDFSFIDAAPQPGLNGNDAAPTAGAHYMIVPEMISDAEKEAAKAWINYFASQEVQANWSMTIGYVPIRSSVEKVEEYTTFISENPYANVAFEQALIATPAFTDPTNGQIIDALEIAADKVELQNVPAQEALDEAQAIAQAALNEVLESQ